MDGQVTTAPMDNMTFERALLYIKKGQKVGRKEWKNAKYCFLVDGSTFAVNRPPLNKWFDDGAEVTYRPHIDMVGADNTIGTWSPSMVDLMAEDWYIVP